MEASHKRKNGQPVKCGTTLQGHEGESIAQRASLNQRGMVIEFGGRKVLKNVLKLTYIYFFIKPIKK